MITNLGPLPNGIPQLVLALVWLVFWIIPVLVTKNKVVFVITFSVPIYIVVTIFNGLFKPEISAPIALFFGGVFYYLFSLPLDTDDKEEGENK